MIATGMSEREEGMRGSGMMSGREKSRLLHSRTHAHTQTCAHAPFRAIISQDMGKASETGEASVNRHEAQDRTSRRRRGGGRRVGKRELSLALGVGKTLCGSQG